MLKRWLGRLLGFQAEIDSLQQQLSDLSWDATFGMWTRPAFLQFCHVMPRGQRIVMFLDLDGIHGMNLRFGYEQVNERIRTAFSVFYRRSDVVARWFSGDEIVILFDSDGAGAVRKIDQLEEAARRQGLTFTYRLGEWEVGKQAIEEVIDGLAEQVNREKAPKEG